MTFFFDHDVPHDLSHALRALGHEVVELREVLPVTTPDAEVLRFATAHDYVVVTCNRDDFIALAEGAPHAGIIVLIRRQTRRLERDRFITFLDRSGETGIRGNINLA